MSRSSRRDEAIAHHHMVTAMALADIKALELQAAEAAERHRVKSNEFLNIAFGRQEREHLRIADITRLTQQGAQR